MKLFLLFTCCLLVVHCAPKKEEYEHDAKIGSDEHSTDHDHEMFQGKDHAHDFDDLSPEDSKRALGKIFDTIDKDNDEKVSQEEMINQIHFAQGKYAKDDAETQMKTNDHDVDGSVSWDEYKNNTYGLADEHEEESMKTMLERDQNRFRKADTDGNSVLSLEEFESFLHPENDQNMRDVVIQETIDDIDKNKDGKISLDEYIADLWPQEERTGDEPDWVKQERNSFSEERDKDKDGFMDKTEVGGWIMPDEMDHVTSEAKHLISESDTDKDGSISKQEMLDKHDLFVGSQATDFGEALKRHQEL